jgi:hypothetical protein
MKIAIINGLFLEISVDNIVVCNEKYPHDNLSLYLNKYLPSLNNITEVYLMVSPGSLMASRNLIAYFLGLTNFLHNKNIKVFLIDIIRDWYLKKWPDKKIIFPFTNKKLLVGYLENNQYKYYFIDSLENIDGDYLLDYNIKNFNFHYDENFNFHYDEKKLIHWSSKNLLECSLEFNTLSNIIQYKTW